MTVRTALSPANQVKFYQWLTRVRGSLVELGLEEKNLVALQEAFDRPRLARYSSLGLFGRINTVADSPDKLRVILALMVLDGTFVVQDVAEDGCPTVRMRTIPPVVEIEDTSGESLWPENLTVCNECGNDMLQAPHHVDKLGVRRCGPKPEETE